MNIIPYVVLRSAYSTCRSATQTRAAYGRVNPQAGIPHIPRVNPVGLTREGHRAGGPLARGVLKRARTPAVSILAFVGLRVNPG